MIVLGIETSCDETAAAVVCGDGRILADAVLSQRQEHAPYGGVVPEIAARAHLEHLDRMIRQAMHDAGVGFDDLSGVAATCGPGLIGGVMVGAMTGKAIAAVRALPFVAVNHLEAHALTPRLTHRVAFPYLLLLVSGGHCQILVVEGVGHYRRLGTTIDDAVGEAFDKVAKMVGLGYPGGPQVEAAARQSTAPGRFPLPRPMLGRPDCDFSFSGLKTAVRRHCEAVRAETGLAPAAPLPAEVVADLCAAFQHAVADVFADRCRRALTLFREQYPAGQTVVVAGGVAANHSLRSRLTAVCAEAGLAFVAPPLALCTDNGAMVAWAGVERLRLGLHDSLDIAPRPRWPLDPSAQPRPGRPGRPGSAAGIKA